MVELLELSFVAFFEKQKKLIYVVVAVHRVDEQMMKKFEQLVVVALLSLSFVNTANVGDAEVFQNANPFWMDNVHRLHLKLWQFFLLERVFGGAVVVENVDEFVVVECDDDDVVVVHHVNQPVEVKNHHQRPLEYGDDEVSKNN